MNNPYQNLSLVELRAILCVHRNNPTIRAEIEKLINGRKPTHNALHLGGDAVSTIADALESTITNEISNAENGDSGTYDPEKCNHVIKARQALLIIDRAKKWGAGNSGDLKHRERDSQTQANPRKDRQGRSAQNHAR